MPGLEYSSTCSTGKMAGRKIEAEVEGACHRERIAWGLPGAHAGRRMVNARLALSMYVLVYMSIYPLSPCRICACLTRAAEDTLYNKYTGHLRDGISVVSK